MKRSFQTVSDLVARLRVADADEFACLERALASDTRLGVQKALDQTRRRVSSDQAELDRVRSMYSFEDAFSDGVIVGLDEVGRGPIAGPLVVGAVVLPREPIVEGLNDSKKVPEKKRSEIAQTIKKVACAWTVSYVDASTIDTLGMGQSLRLAFSQAVAQIEESGITPDCLLVDGNPLHIDARERNVVKGDCLSASIAAASIVAKVSRDAYMVEQSQLFPHYRFESNKGYASEGHRAAIRKHGLSPLHRLTFCSAFLQETLF